MFTARESIGGEQQALPVYVNGGLHRRSSCTYLAMTCYNN